MSKNRKLTNVSQMLFSEDMILSVKQQIMEKQINPWYSFIFRESSSLFLFYLSSFSYCSSSVFALFVMISIKLWHVVDLYLFDFLSTTEKNFVFYLSVCILDKNEIAGPKSGKARKSSLVHWSSNLVRKFFIIF